VKADHGVGRGAHPGGRGYLVNAAHAQMFAHFAFQARAWTRDLVVFTNAAVDVPDETRAKLAAGGIRLETPPVERLVASEGRLEAVALTDGTRVPCDALFAHPPQRQVDLVRALGLLLDEQGFVQVNEMTCETSVPGIYAAGDLATRMQGAMLAAAAAVRAATMLNVELTTELAVQGEI
jgi:thioredoxin reductase